MLKDRRDAGKKLADKLKSYRGKNAIVLALPRGGVVVGAEISKILSLPLDIIVTRKISHPSNPEYAIGAVNEEGLTVLNEFEISSIDKNYLQSEIENQKEEAKRRVKHYRKDKVFPDLRGKLAILVDDGIATGFTMRLAIKAAKKQRPEKIIVATAVAPLDVIEELKREGADKIVLIESSHKFLGSVGAYYKEFDQTSDKEVVELLNY